MSLPSYLIDKWSEGDRNTTAAIETTDDEMML